MKVAEMETIKLQKGTKGRKAPVFQAKDGVEGLFHVIDKFLKAAACMAFTKLVYWDQFEDVLEMAKEDKWMNLITPIADADRDVAQFDMELDNFVALYAEADNPRDDMIKYLQSDCWKPRKVDSGKHASRIKTMCHYVNRLKGMHPPLSANEIKLIIFESFPAPWQFSFKKSGHKLSTETLLEIVKFMNLCKGEADANDNKRGKKRDLDEEVQRVRGGGNNNGQ